MSFVSWNLVNGFLVVDKANVSRFTNFGKIVGKECGCIAMLR